MSTVLCMQQVTVGTICVPREVRPGKGLVIRRQDVGESGLTLGTCLALWLWAMVPISVPLLPGLEAQVDNSCVAVPTLRSGQESPVCHQYAQPQISPSAVGFWDRPIAHFRIEESSDSLQEPKRLPKSPPGRPVCSLS